MISGNLFYIVYIKLLLFYFEILIIFVRNQIKCHATYIPKYRFSFMRNMFSYGRCVFYQLSCYYFQWQKNNILTGIHNNDKQKGLSIYIQIYTYRNIIYFCFFFFCSTLKSFSFLFQKGLEFKGQMVLCNESDSLLYVGSPLLDGLDSLTSRSLFISDIPLHDATRDVILVGEQARAQVQKEKIK